MLPTVPSFRQETAATARSTAATPKSRARTRSKPRPNPLAEISGTIASASVTTIDGQRGIMAAIAGVARLRAGSASVPIGSLVFVPATASDDEARAAVHREFIRVASSRLASAGHAVPSDRITVVLR